GRPALEILEPPIVVADGEADGSGRGSRTVIPHGGADARDERDEKRDEAPHQPILSEGFALGFPYRPLPILRERLRQGRTRDRLQQRAADLQPSPLPPPHPARTHRYHPH